MAMHSSTPTRRDFLKLAGTGAALAAIRSGAACAETSASRPNVLVILADDLGYGDLSSYGATDLKSPNIDGLVAAGMRFDFFYANCPVCSPTRAALMTGRYPDLVGVPGVIRTHIADNWGYLLPQAVLLPQMLKRAGYHTAGVGKWHLGLAAPNLPNERGFDHFHGFLGDMMDDYYTHRRHGFNYMRLNDTEIDPEGHATDLFTQWAIDYLRERSQKKEQPFFLYLAYNAPHAPIQPPQEWLDRVKQREPGISERRAKLAALVEHLDDGIGKVLMVLKETGLSSNTLVIFTSDNGGQLSLGSLNGPLRAGKGDMYEGGIREPMCAVWPGKIAPGNAAWERRSPDQHEKESQSGDWRSQANQDRDPQRDSSRLGTQIGGPRDPVALTMDLFPTICEVAGVPIEHEIDGRSILPTLMGKTQPEDDRILFWVRREGGPQYGGRAYYAARQGDFKLLQNSPFEPMELYNLKDDPQEQKPLGRKHPMYNKLFTALQGHITQAGAVSWQKYPVDLKQPLTHQP
jgi:arylsulfatase A-like enzyme